MGKEPRSSALLHVCILHNIKRISRQVGCACACNCECRSWALIQTEDRVCEATNVTDSHSLLRIRLVHGRTSPLNLHASRLAFGHKGTEALSPKHCYFETIVSANTRPTAFYRDHSILATLTLPCLNLQAFHAKTRRFLLCSEVRIPWTSIGHKHRQAYDDHHIPTSIWCA